jgi:hypothetical protein
MSTWLPGTSWIFQAAYDLALSVRRIAVVATRPIAAPQQQYTSGIRSRFVILRGENRHVLDIIQPMMEGPTCTQMNTLGRGTREALSQASSKAKTSAHIWRSLRRLEMQVHLSSRPLSGSQYNKPVKSFDPVTETRVVGSNEKVTEGGRRFFLSVS